MPVHVNTAEININHISFVYFIAFFKSQCFPSTYFTVNPKHAHKNHTDIFLIAYQFMAIFPDPTLFTHKFRHN